MLGTDMEEILCAAAAVSQLALLQSLLARKREKPLGKGLLLPSLAGVKDHFAPLVQPGNTEPFSARHGKLSTCVPLESDQARTLGVLCAAKRTRPETDAAANGE